MTSQIINSLSSIAQGCVYLIICKINGKIYCGSTRNIGRRWSCHKSNLKNNKHFSRILQDDYNKYGINNFILLIVKFEEDQNLRRFHEHNIIGKLIKKNMSYNKIFSDFSKFESKKKLSVPKIDSSYKGLYSYFSSEFIKIPPRKHYLLDSYN